MKGVWLHPQKSAHWFSEGKVDGAEVCKGIGQDVPSGDGGPGGRQEGLTNCPDVSSPLLYLLREGPGAGKG